MSFLQATRWSSPSQRCLHLFGRPVVCNVQKAWLIGQKKNMLNELKARQSTWQNYTLACKSCYSPIFCPKNSRTLHIVQWSLRIFDFIEPEIQTPWTFRVSVVWIHTCSSLRNLNQGPGIGWEKNKYTPEVSHSPWKMMVGRLLSYWVSVTFQGRAVKLQGGLWMMEKLNLSYLSGKHE